MMKKRLVASNKNIVLTTIAIIIAMPFLGKITLEQGFPIFLHYLTKEPAQITVTIDEKVSLKRCRNGVQLRGFEYFANGRVCGLSKETLNILKAGDRLKLIGEKSFFGFTYTAYQYEKVKIPQGKPSNIILQPRHKKSSKEVNSMISEKELATFYDYIDNE